MVAGSGPVGLAATIGLAMQGFSVRLAGAPTSSSGHLLDPRTFALFRPSLRFLDNLGVALPASASGPLNTIRLIDDTGRLIRAPEAVFEARDLGLQSFGWNIPHASLTKSLLERLRSLISSQTFTSVPLVALQSLSSGLAAKLSSSEVVTCRLLLGADGRQSTCRSLGAFRTRRWTYPQSALVASIAHSRPHHGVSTELHRPAGPLTTVPLPDNASSIVWVEQPAEAERLAALDDRDFVQTLHGRLQGFLGRIEAVGPRRVFPLEGLVAEPAAQGRIALAGESLHAFPPIGAQGLNLGFRDVASLLDALADARHEATDDPGHPQVAQAYARDRKIDIEASVLMVDMLDRSLFSGLLPLQLLRGAGLHLAKASPALRRSMMRKGMSPAPKVPRLMREAIDSESSDHA